MNQENVATLVKGLRFGNSVAEHDSDLRDYFVRTTTFSDILNDEGDIIAGDKGTGKSAIYKILREEQQSYKELDNVLIVTGFNPQGQPAFKRLAEAGDATESAYIGLWKSYFLGMIGNAYLDSLDEYNYNTGAETELSDLLVALGIRQKADAKGFFSKLVQTLKQRRAVDSVSGSASLGADGMPIVTGSIQFGDPVDVDEDGIRYVRHEDSLAILDAVLNEFGIQAWLIMDRLDEAFQATPDLETPALKALLRAYLDVQEFKNFRIKIFVRHDLFERITEGGFVNLTHINSRRIDITWDEADLWDLVFRRASAAADVWRSLNINPDDKEAVLSGLLPDKVDQGSKRPTTKNWIMARIRDGNGSMPPRNLIDLLLEARAAQSRTEQRSPRQAGDWRPLLSPEAMKEGLRKLSETRVQDTLFAEAADDREIIERFRDGKAGHNITSLTTLLDAPAFDRQLGRLLRLGFLEKTGERYSVPMLYRGGLNITMGMDKTAASDVQDMADEELDLLSDEGEES